MDCHNGSISKLKHNTSTVATSGTRLKLRLLTTDPIVEAKADIEEMADHLNDARAMRIAEIMQQYRQFQQQIAASRVNVPNGQGQARGYLILASCMQQAQALLAQPLNLALLNGTIRDDEATKRQLQKLMLDATARRFKAYKLVSRVTCCMRWISRRAQVLRGGQPTKQHTAALAQCDNVLNQELAALTDTRLYSELKARDVQAGHWMAEMPSQQTLLSYIQAN